MQVHCNAIRWILHKISSTSFNKKSYDIGRLFSYHGFICYSLLLHYRFLLARILAISILLLLYILINTHYGMHNHGYSGLGYVILDALNSCSLWNRRTYRSFCHLHILIVRLCCFWPLNYCSDTLLLLHSLSIIKWLLTRKTYNSITEKSHLSYINDCTCPYAFLLHWTRMHLQWLDFFICCIDERHQ